MRQTSKLITVACRKCGSHEKFTDKRPDRLFQCSGCGAVLRFEDSEIVAETREERDQRLIESWVNGNRKDVAEEVAKMRRCDVIRFTLSLAGGTSLSEPMILSRLLEAMKWPL